MKKQNEEAYAKLLDHWEPPADAGSSIGMISTTFTFQSDFFEENCLSRFLQMETDAMEDGGLYIIEQEEKLQSLQCAAVWVDQAYAKQMRNLRWDLLPFRFHSSILHAKISCLLWSNHARIILGSANLTTVGYRKNQELMMVLDWNKSEPGDGKTGTVIVDYLLELLIKHQQSDLLVTNRSKDFLISFKSKIKNWSEVERPIRTLGYKLFPLMVNPSLPSLLEQSKQIWLTEASSVLPDYCAITSPFFDQSPSNNNASLHIRDLLRKKGQVNICYLTTGEWDSDNDEVQLIHMPFFIKSQKLAGNVNLSVECISEFEQSTSANRPLHAKSIWWESSDGWMFYVIGSSNFTAKGLGLSKNSNHEANIGILTHRDRYIETYLRLGKSFTNGVQVDINSVKWLALPPEDEASTEVGFTPLHPFFQSATLSNESGIQLKLIFSDRILPPDQFEIRMESGQKVFDNKQWVLEGSTFETTIPFKTDSLPAGFNVSWQNMKKTAWLTLNIETQEVLPQPEDLRNLSLDALTRVLTSAKPLHVVLKSWFGKRKGQTSNVIQDELDPHQRVNTSSFLLQRIRKYSNAINQLKNQLELPVSTLESLNWRLNGPVGLMAFWRALQKEAKSVNEEMFFLSELILTLAKTKPQSKTNYLSPRSVSREIEKVKSFLRSILKQKLKESKASTMKLYSKKVLQKTI